MAGYCHQYITNKGHRHQELPARSWIKSIRQMVAKLWPLKDCPMLLRTFTLLPLSIWNCRDFVNAGAMLMKQVYLQAVLKITSEKCRHDWHNVLPERTPSQDCKQWKCPSVDTPPMPHTVQYLGLKVDRHTQTNRCPTLCNHTSNNSACRALRDRLTDRQDHFYELDC